MNVELTEEQWKDVEQRLTDGEKTIEMLHTRLHEDVQTARFETLGWAIAYACNAVKEGIDIREVETTTIVTQMQTQLVEGQTDD